MEKYCLVKERLSENTFQLLERIGCIGRDWGQSVYVVGGFVRDLLLNIPSHDIDIVIEGDGIKFGNRLAAELEATVQAHEKFGTSVVLFQDGFRVDVATAREETYESPGALPTVKESLLEPDLSRRDFTINSMAIQLSGGQPFSLIDNFNGKEDLKNKKIKILHDLSFIDDPCRLFRAIRYEQRFGFEMEEQTETCFRQAIEKNSIDTLSGTRLFNEIKLLLNEKKPAKYIHRGQTLNVFKSVSPGFIHGSGDLEVFESIVSALSWSGVRHFHEKPEAWYVYFLGLFFSLSEADFNKLVERLQLPVRIKDSLNKDRSQCSDSLKWIVQGKELKPKDILHAFEKLSVEAVILLTALSPSKKLRAYIELYFTQYKEKAEPLLNGDDLLNLGMKAGPVFQSVFRAIREARVEGLVTSREDEVALVKDHFLSQNNN